MSLDRLQFFKSRKNNNKNKEIINVPKEVDRVLCGMSSGLDLCPPWPLCCELWIKKIVNTYLREGIMPPDLKYHR